MHAHRDEERSSGSLPDASADDAHLVARWRDGDPDALRTLIARYDRLVRYTVFRLSGKQCARDPQWLDSVASAAWSGFVGAMERRDGDDPRSLRGYLVQIASNQTISALRRLKEPMSGWDDADPRHAALPDPISRPDEIVSDLEQISLLRECLSDLPSESRRMFAQIHSILERRWEEAAAELQVSESTLRSRWKVILEALRKCISDKMGGLGS